MTEWTISLVKRLVSLDEIKNFLKTVHIFHGQNSKSARKEALLEEEIPFKLCPLWTICTAVPEQSLHSPESLYNFRILDGKENNKPLYSVIWKLISKSLPPVSFFSPFPLF